MRFVNLLHFLDEAKKQQYFAEQGNIQEFSGGKIKSAMQSARVVSLQKENNHVTQEILEAASLATSAKNTTLG